MKVAGLVCVFGIIICVTGMVHSQDWTYYYLKAACKLLEGRQLRSEHSTESKKAIAFQARASVRLVNIPQNNVVKFNQVLLNEGNGYSGETGIFTAPDDGVYFFDWTITVDNGDEFHTEIVRNGSVFGYSYCGSRGQNFARPCTATGRIKLKRGDKVWIRTSGRGADAHPKYTTFGGHRL